MNKFVLLKMYLRRGDHSLVQRVVYDLSGQHPKLTEVPGGSTFLVNHVVQMKAHSGDKFAVTDAEVGESYKGLPIFSSSDLKRLVELCHE